MRRLLVCAIAAALAGPFTPAIAAAPAPASASVTTQLPREVRPSHYQVEITPHAQAMDFDGKVAVDIEVLAPTSRITLNAIDMTFSKGTLTPLSSKGGVRAASKMTVDAKEQTATFEFATPIAPGKYRLAMEYGGKIGTQAIGLFAMDYATPSGSKRAIYTQFENSDARRFIPCWDEPAYKATFDLEVTVPAAQMAVSNMPVTRRTEIDGGLAKVRFATSPKMSTYLLFFGLGDFERATLDADGTEVGVVTQRGKLDQAATVLAASQTILREFNDYFAVPYPLPKLDNVASPGSNQFFGAMENWGAIYSFESSMLVDPGISTESDKRRVYQVAAHEIAHQWFGDLVTMQWWDDLWLNEGFASWMAGRITHKLHPEWNTALAAVGGREEAMRLDGVASTHPVVQHVETVEQASQAFDSITYSKGEAVIGMLEAYVGADAWRDGVRAYMKAHAYGNTVSDDLWREMDKTAGKPILDIAHDFTLQPGVPMIRIDSASCSNGKTTLQLRQEEFSVDRPDKTPLRWRVPVNAAMAGSNAKAQALVADGRGTLELAGCGTVIVNAGQSGYYRTLYGPGQVAAIKRDFATIAPIDQLGILADSWSLGLAGYGPTSDFLDLAEVAPVDADTQVWSRIASVLGSINSYYDGDPVRQKKIQAFAIERLQPVFARIGWTAKPGEPGTDAILRNSLISTLSSLGDPVVIAEARRRYAAQASDPSAMPAALRQTILGVVARHASAADWDKLRAAARAETTPMVKDRMYLLLAASKDPALAQRALDLSLTDEPGQTNTSRMISGVSFQHPELAFDFAMAHLAAVDARVDASSRSRYYPSLGAGSSKPEMIAKIRAFAQAELAPGSRRSADTAIASIEYRIKVRRERLPAIEGWLDGHAAK